MESNQKNRRVYEVLITITGIPKNLVHLNGIDNLAEFVLHDLCQKKCFNVSKAALFIDNPDFDQFQGIAGFSTVESYQPTKPTHWHEPQEFSHHMKKAHFNNKVRDVCRCSIKRNNQSEQEVIQELGQQLEFSNPQYMLWPVKYDNNGLLMFEKSEQDGTEDHLENALHLFGFCPIF